MGIEIERKFLVHGQAWRQGTPQRLCQGYLSRDPARTVRVRVAGEAGFLTIKGATTGTTRAEFEYPIPLADAQALLALCEGPSIDKWRYRVAYQGLVWEVDEFLGANAGLVVAEVELPHPDTPVPLPDWVAAEVSHDVRYFNSHLARHPFSQW